MGVAGMGVLLAGCATRAIPPSGGGPGGGAAPASAATKVSADGKCVEIPTETNGPYPADGTNSNNLSVLTRSGIVRSDIRPSLSTKNVAAGEFTLININNACAPLSGYATLLHTSQLAVPKDACDAVYGTADGYSSSVTNLSQLTLATDNVFSDTGASSQLATVTGSVAAGYAFKLTAGVAA